jgi:myo-inositol-1-phosphate synthase
MDAIRFCQVARDRGEGGVLAAESAYYCKHPSQQMAENVALDLLDARAVPRLDAAE